MTDEFLTKLSTYYNYHNVSEKYKLTFIDFVNCVTSGYWQEMTKNLSGSTIHLKSNVSDFTIELMVGNSGYEVHECVGGNKTIKNFGAEGLARAKAVQYYEEQKHRQRKSLLSV